MRFGRCAHLFAQFGFDRPRIPASPAASHAMSSTSTFSSHAELDPHLVAALHRCAFGTCLQPGPCPRPRRVYHNFGDNVGERADHDSGSWNTTGKHHLEVNKGSGTSRMTAGEKPTHDSPLTLGNSSLLKALHLHATRTNTRSFHARFYPPGTTQNLDCPRKPVPLRLAPDFGSRTV